MPQHRVGHLSYRPRYHFPLWTHLNSLRRNTIARGALPTASSSFPSMNIEPESELEEQAQLSALNFNHATTSQPTTITAGEVPRARAIGVGMAEMQELNPELTLSSTLSIDTPTFRHPPITRQRLGPDPVTNPGLFISLLVKHPHGPIPETTLAAKLPQLDVSFLSIFTARQLNLERRPLPIGRRRPYITPTGVICPCRFVYVTISTSTESPSMTLTMLVLEPYNLPDGWRHIGAFIGNRALDKLESPLNQPLDGATSSRSDTQGSTTIPATCNSQVAPMLSPIPSIQYNLTGSAAMQPQQCQNLSHPPSICIQPDAGLSLFVDNPNNLLLSPANTTGHLGLYHEQGGRRSSHLVPPPSMNMSLSTTTACLTPNPSILSCDEESSTIATMSMSSYNPGDYEAISNSGSINGCPNETLLNFLPSSQQPQQYHWTTDQFP